jgi:hypothetical protein
MGWHEHDEAVFHGCEKFFRPSYAANLVGSWIPSLESARKKLEAGLASGRCGLRQGSVDFVDGKSVSEIRILRIRLLRQIDRGGAGDGGERRAGGASEFGVAKAKEFPGKDYDLVTMFDCLHDMGDPVGVATHVRKALRDDGTWMIVDRW